MRSSAGFDQLQHLGAKTAGPTLTVEGFKYEAPRLLQITTFSGLARQLVQLGSSRQEGSTGSRINSVARLMQGE